MKTKTPLLYLLSFVFCLALSPVPCALSQIPQGFNYQAIARDGSGNILPNTPLQAMLYIQSLSTGGTIFWKELHASVTTNSFGLFTLVIGTGVRQPASIVASFDLIDWSVTPKYLKSEIYYSGSWKDMGASQLYSVPYAMTARDLKGTTKLGITGTTANLEEALFEVKNKDGQTVFAVYNEGVRVYVSNGSKAVKGGFAVGGFGTDKAETTKYLFVGKDSVRIYIDTNPLTKGTKSGFAVGGYDLTKGTVQNYLDVSEDSVRVYIDSNPATKATKGGFAVGGYDMTKGTMTNYMNVNTDATGIINPSQNRILWYPLKNAFLTGRVLIESPANVGENSFATGYEAKAKGMYSQAMGFMPQALGNYSTAIGKDAVAESNNSFAFGNGANAKGLGSYAFGANAQASGDLSFALGSVGIDSIGDPTGKTTASGYAAFAIGFGSVASGQGAFTLGVNDTASGPYSTAIGYESAAKGWYSMSLGAFTKTGGIGSLATGWGTEVEPIGFLGIGSMGAMANGISTRASNFAAVSFGDRTTASGHTSFATGYSTVASGQLSATFGAVTTASGAGAIAMGDNTTAQAYASLVLGRYNIVSGSPLAWYFWEPVFVIGNGTSSSVRSNAMTVYKSGVADFAGYLNLNTSLSYYEAIKINNVEALWYNGTYFSWGYGGTYNVFAQPVSVATTANPAGYGLYVAGSVYATGGWAGSDARWKKDLEPLQSTLLKTLKLQGYKYNWKADEFPEKNFDNERQIGLIAQDVEKIYPELVKTDQNGYKAVSYEKLTVLLIEGMKEQQKQIESTKQENQQLKSELQSLREEMAEIKGMLAKGEVR